MSFDVIHGLHILAKTPKANAADIEARSKLRHHIHREMQATPAHHKAALLGDIIQHVKNGNLSPDAVQAKYARNGEFPKGAGPAINWLSSVLDHADAETRASWQKALPAEDWHITEAIRRRKPWVGVVDPWSKPLKPFLKNHLAIGVFPEQIRLAQTPKNIGIVGEGLTGKLTGYLLNQVSRDIHIDYFERDAVAGGRMHTHVTASGALLEGGAMRLPKSGKTIHHFLRTLGIGREGEETVPFPNMGTNVSGKILYKGEVVDWPAHQSAPNHPFLREVVEKFNAFSDRLRAPLEQARAMHDELAVKNAWQGYITAYSGKTIRELLEKECAFSPAQVEAFESVGLETGRLDNYFRKNVSALEFARELTADLTKGQGLLVNGTRNAVERLGQHRVDRTDGTHGALDDISQRHYQTEVTKISQSDGKPVLHYIDKNGQTHTQKYDAVVLTPPAGSLHSIDLHEVFDERMLSAISNFQMLDSTKLIVETKPFWLDETSKMKPGMVPVMLSDKPGMSSSYFVSYPPKDGEAAKHVAYLDYRWDHYDATPQEYLQHTKDVISEIHPEMGKHLETSIGEPFVKDWCLSGGAFRELSATQDHQHHVLADALSPQSVAKAKAPVLFASADNVLGGYTETSATEAVRAAKATIEILGGTVHKDMPKFESFIYPKAVSEAAKFTA